MGREKFLTKFYLDKEKDIIINIYNSGIDELTYIIETPNHNTGNLITNLAKICEVETIKNENDMKIIKGKLQASLNGDNQEVYIFRIGGIKIANIFPNGKVEVKAKVPAIIKTLMSQTKNYKIDIKNSIVKSYILKKSKFRTDLHTHMNANLPAECLIALGIRHQIKYPLYYIKKLNLLMTTEQEEKILKHRKEIEKKFENSELKGKYLIRKIDDNTFINFADLILNNPQNASENLNKISKSLEILKDGQAVFTNLEKLYIYRYVFAKGEESNEKIRLSKEEIELTLKEDIKDYLLQMLEDSKKGCIYEKNTLRQNKLLWIAREYKKQGIRYVEISDTALTKKGIDAIKFVEEIHQIMPAIEKETNVKIRFLYAMRRVVLNIIKDEKTNSNYLRENINILHTIAKSPYIVGSDFIGEEINDIRELKPVIKEIVEYINKEDNKFTIKIHAGENDSLKNNVGNSIMCIKEALAPNQKMPRCRIGHGLYTPNLDSEEGKNLIKEIKEAGVILEFQLTSNVRLNNLSSLENHPIKKYLTNNVKCVQGTDGCGFYGIDTIDEQLALQNIIGLTDKDFEKMRQVEDETIKYSDVYFKEKSKAFQKFLNGRTILDAMMEDEIEVERENINNNIPLRVSEKQDAKTILKDRIKKLPTDKFPIIIAGGSFNAKGRETQLTQEGRKILTKLIQRIDGQKAYFVVGHKMQGYEKAIIDIAKELNKNIEVDAIIPKMVSKDVQENILQGNINGVCISTESEEFGIYKSFNYEIFERRNSVVIAFDGNSPVSNLVQEAKNGKGKAKIYVNEDNENLKQKANSLEGYVIPFKMRENIVDKILKDNPELTSDVYRKIDL